jgi:phage-related protein
MSEAWNWLSGVASSVWSGIRSNIIQPLQAAWNWISGFATGVNNTIQGGFNDVLNWLGGIGSKFLSVGEDIVNGIISGIDSAGGALMNKLGNLANDALHAARSFLGIGSPSKEFASQVGQWIPHGVAQGIADHSQVAIQAVQTMAGALPQAIGVQGAVNLGVNGLNAAGSTFATGLGLGVPSAAGGAGDVHVHIDLRDAVVAGDRGIQDLAAKIGNSFVTKTLPQAGVRMHQ